MPKHRTKKQKIKTVEKRIEAVQQLSQVSQTQTGLKYSFLGGVASPSSSPTAAPLSKERAWDDQRVAYFKKDILKTVVVSLVIVGIIFFLKWKLAL